MVEKAGGQMTRMCPGPQVFAVAWRRQYHDISIDDEIDLERQQIGVARALSYLPAGIRQDGGGDVYRFWGQLFKQPSV